MKAKIFDVILHKLPPGKSPAVYLEEQLNGFFKQHQAIRVVATHVILREKGVPEGSESGRPRSSFCPTLSTNKVRSNAILTIAKGYCHHIHKVLE